MKSIKIFSLLLGGILLMSAAKAGDGVMTKEDGMYVVNTTSLGKKVTGYVGSTPLKIFIKKDKIVRVEALRNQETPKHNALVKKKMLIKYEGMKVKDVTRQKVDGVTVATYTSNAMKKNVQLGAEYYLKNK